MLKYFCQVLYDFRDFKDIENIPLYANEKKDQSQLSKTLPNFDYCGLYRTLSQLVDILPLIPHQSTGYEQLASNLLMLFKCLVPFLDQTNMETMPYLVSTLFMSLPHSMHKEILDTLCYNSLPFTIDQQQRHTAAMMRKAKIDKYKLCKKDSAKGQTDLQGQASKPFHCIVRIMDSDETQDPGELSASGEGADGVTREGSERLKADQTADEEEISEVSYGVLSVTSIMMITFHYNQEASHHSQLIECLMKLKDNVFEDLLYVIAYGTTRARRPAVELLFRYWPDICPNRQDRKGSNQASKLKHVQWVPTRCQNKSCSLTNSTLGDDEAVKMCLDFKMSITLGGLPPPLLVCLDCVDTIYKQQRDGVEHLDDYGNKFVDLLLPMERVSKLCENKRCKSMDRVAIGTCFDIECANYSSKRPIRYCKTCFVSIHEPCEANNFDVTLHNHIRHSSLNLKIMQDEESINNFVEAIISLLKEAAPAEKAPIRDGDRHLRALMGQVSSQLSGSDGSGKEGHGHGIASIATEEKQLISQYGIWLMTGLCRSVEKLSDETLGRLLGMLFQWFHFTACLPDDQAGSALEKLKGECIKGWIMEVKTKRLDVFINCLLPHPTDCSKIGGHWEVWPDTAHQIKEGFKRLLCLVPYDIITDDVWDEIMPYWMECFRHEVPENELNELKILLSKVFDPELSPLGFETKQMYNFISSRFEDSTNAYQEQTLYWLQIITMLEIPIPINFLYQMLRSGVESLGKIRENELNKLKMANRLMELEKEHLREKERVGRPRSGSSSRSSSATDEDDKGADNYSESEQISIVEDEVMLPADQNEESELEKKRSMTKQERQAAARAAFSAKLMREANLLDASIMAGQKQSSAADTSLAKEGHVDGLRPCISHPTNLGTDLMGGRKLATSSIPMELKGLSAGTDGTSVSSREKFSPPSSATPIESPPTTHEQQKPSAMKKAKKQKIDKTGTKGLSSDGYRSKGQHQSSKPKLKLNLESIEEQESMGGAIDNNLVCYILMIDILLKQLDLQEMSSHRGLDGKEAQQAIELLNFMISTPWLGKHTCSDSVPLPGSPTLLSQAQGSSGTSPSGGNFCQGSSAKQASDSSSSANKVNPNDVEHSDEHRQTAIQLANEVHGFGHCVQGFEQDETSNEFCVCCEILSTFFRLSLALIEFFSPLIEVSICEVSQDAANGEFDGQPDYSRIGLDHLDPSPPAPASDAGRPSTPRAGSKFVFDTQNKLQKPSSSDQNSPFSPSYTGPTLKAEVLATLPEELQLCYNLLVQCHLYQSPDIVSQLLQMIKLISLHSQVLSKAVKMNSHFISWCQHNMLVKKLWSLCQLESSEIARICVPLLLHCITLPWGVRLFRDLVERDFNNDNWLTRMKAVERVKTIAHFCEPSTIKNSTLLQSTMASAFCYMLKCLDDIEAIVAQRALVSLEMMKTSSLKLFLWCLEVQFDYVIIDRPMILHCVFQLYNHLRDRRFITWEFFLNRFDTVFLEAQVYLQQTGEIPSFTMQDLKNTNTKSEIYQKKIARAREALQGTHHSRSLSSRLNLRNHSNHRFSVGQSKVNDSDDTLQNATTLQEHYKKSIKLQKIQQELVDEATEGQEERSNADQLGARKFGPSPTRRVLQHGRSTSSRYQSIAFLTSQSLASRKNSKSLTNLALHYMPLPSSKSPAAFLGNGGRDAASGDDFDGITNNANPLPMGNISLATSSPLISIPEKLHQHLPNSFVDDGSKMNEISQENHAFGVVHRAIDEDRDTNHSLIFLLMQFFSKPDPSHPQTTKSLNRSHQIVLRHLNILMGFSVARKNFLIPASNLRLLPVFNAFLTSLSKVLDFNYTLGTILLDTCLPLLIYCPAPDEVQYDQLMRNAQPGYSLWLLNPLMRQSWLTSVMAFLYKYQFGQQHLKDQVNALMWIVINTLECHLNTTAVEHKTSRRHQHMYHSPVDSKSSTASSHQPQSGGQKYQHQNQRQRTTDSILAASTSQQHVSSDDKTIVPSQIGAQKRDVTGVTEKSNETIEGIEMQSMVKDPKGRHLLTSSKEKRSPHAAITKAETSDNFNSRTKFFQSKQQPQQEQPSIQHEVHSTKPVQLALGGPSSPVVVSGGQLAESSCRSGEERLLPIGGTKKVTASQSTSSDSHQIERLIPIGTAPPPSKPNDEMQSKQNQNYHQSLSKASSDTLRDAPLLGLRSTGLAGSLIHTPSSADSPTTEHQRQHPTKIHKLAGQFGGSFQVTAGESPSQPQTSKCLRAGESPSSSFAPLAHEVHSSQAVHASSLDRASGGTVQGDSRKVSPRHSKQTGMKASVSSPSLLSEQLAHLNRHSFVQEFSDKDLSLCLVILETFIHHEPSMAARMLPNILRLVARYSLATSESWHGSSNAHLVGGSMFVARQFIRVALHDLTENNVFQQIFSSNFTGYEFYKSMATALTEFSDLNQLSPLSRLFEDLNKQKNLPQASTLVTILDNVATYFDCITSDSNNLSLSTWNQFILNWENFLKKLILALPRFTGSAVANEHAVTASPVPSSSGPGGGTAVAAGGGPIGTGAPTSGAPGTGAGGTGGSGKMIIDTASVSGGQQLLPSAVLNEPGDPAADAAPHLASSGVVGAKGSNTLTKQPPQSAGGGPAVAAGAQNQTHRQAVQSSCTMIMEPIMRIILSTTRISHLASCKTIVDPYSKIISFAVLNSHYKYEHLLEINHNCCRLYTRDREKYLIQRTIAYELVQVLKFRFFILEENMLLLLLFMLQDVGGTFAQKVLTDVLKIDLSTFYQTDGYVTNVSDCLRQHMGELLEFITDVHAISRINDNLIGSQPSSINRDSFGGHVKAAISQYLALEISISNKGDQRTILRYLPWLYNSLSLQQGPREFIDCVSHIRQLSWLLLGSLHHYALVRENVCSSLGGRSWPSSNGLASTLPSGGPYLPGSQSAQCKPIPIEKNNSVAEHVQVILAGFAEQSKESVLHMSGLFHAFLLCQLWTMYCETLCQQNSSNPEQYQFCQSTLDDFWAKITPGVLRLVGHSRVMSEMVSTHFLQLIESLIEINSSILIRYLPMWNSIFYSYKRRNKSGNLAIRLQKCIEWQPPDLSEPDVEKNRRRFLNWLEKVQYKMSHIEIQSSQAAPFYLS